MWNLERMSMVQMFRVPRGTNEAHRDLVAVAVTRLHVLQEGEYAPPRTRADCVDGPRPCPWVRCKFNLVLDVTEIGTIRVRPRLLEVPGATMRKGRPKMARLGPMLSAPVERLHVFNVLDAAADAVFDGLPTCALDVAEEGEHTLDEVAAVLGLTRERVRQIEEGALTGARETAPHVTARVADQQSVTAIMPAPAPLPVAKENPMPCSICKQSGHNARGCTGEKPAEAGETAPAAPKKRKAKAPAAGMTDADLKERLDQFVADLLADVQAYVSDRIEQEKAAVRDKLAGLLDE